MTNSVPYPCIEEPKAAGRRARWTNPWGTALKSTWRDLSELGGTSAICILQGTEAV